MKLGTPNDEVDERIARSRRFRRLDALGQDNRHAASVLRCARKSSRAAREELAAATPLAREAAFAVAMRVTARRELFKAKESDRARDCFPERVVRRARGPGVVEVEFELGMRAPRCEMVNFEAAAALAAEESRDGAAVPVEFESTVTELDPFGRGVEAIHRRHA